LIVDSDANVRVIEMDYSWNRSLKEVNKKAFPPKEPEPEAPVIVNGENRKGFFVREKRPSGKRGVLRKERGTASDGEENSDSSSSDEQVEESRKEGDVRVICVWRRKNRQRETDWRKAYSGCDCDYCMGVGKNQTTKNRNTVRKEMVDLL